MSLRDTKNLKRNLNDHPPPTGRNQSGEDIFYF
jgi:hypothetical protein